MPRTRHLFLISLLFLVLGLFMPPQSPAAEKPAFIIARLTPPLWNTDALEVALEPNVDMCRSAYGNAWAEYCSAYIGEYMAAAEGVVLRLATPAKTPVTGRWVWNNVDTLRFVPDTPWPAKTAFNVDLSRLPMPSHIQLQATAVPFSTPPLAARCESGEVWIDPSVQGERAVSFDLRFTTDPDLADPAGRAGVEKRLTLTTPTPATVMGRPQFVWSQNGTSCLVKVPLTELAPQDSTITLRLPGISRISQRDQSTLLVVEKGDLSQIVTVPGKNTLFRIKEASLNLVRNRQLEGEYLLSLQPTLRVHAEALLKALKVVELPAVQNPEATAPYRWTDAPVITEADLQNARPLKTELVRDAFGSGEPFVLRVRATPGAYVYCSLPAGFGPEGNPLSTPWQAVFPATTPEAEVSFLQPGSLLTLSPVENENQLDIFSSGVDTIRWRAQRVLPESMNVLEWASEPFLSPYLAFNESLYAATSGVEGEIRLPAVHEGELTPRFSTLSLQELMAGGTGFMSVQLVGLKDGKEVCRAGRMVLATDLGLVVKTLPDQGREVFVASLTTGQPMSAALVRIIGANGRPVAEARTDTTGRAVLPSVRGLEREKKPVAIVVTADRPGAGLQPRTNGMSGKSETQNLATQDLAWLSLQDVTRRVDYSRFPTQGQMGSPDNLNAYVFSQRGLFRPGETVRFGVMIRRGDWNPLPADLPLTATLYDPSDRVVLKRTFSVGQGLSEQNWTSADTSPTGRYRLDITAADSGFVLGSGAVRLEEFQPDTMGIRADLQPGAPRGWVVTPSGDEALRLRVNLRNLYGLPAADRKIRGEMQAGPAMLRFAGYEDYTFPDTLPLSARADTVPPLPLAEATTNAQGEVALPLPISGYKSGTMRCRVLVEGFEPDGGRAVSTEQSFLLSPLTSMLGYRPTGAVTDTAYVPQGTQGGLELISLNPDLQPTDPGPLRLVVSERRFVITLATNDQGRYVYEEIPVERELSASTLTFSPATATAPVAPAVWTMPTDTPGEFMLTVRNAENRLLARVPFTVAGNDDLRPAMQDDPRNLPASQLRVRLDKTDYAPGDTVNIFMAAPYEGTGLITLERDRVFAHVWFRAKAGHSVHTLTIPKDFEGRGYINISMGRALTSPEIFMQPHSYALAPLSVNVDGRNMGLTLTAPQQVVPGESVQVRLAARQPGKALVFAVDEGVLQLTRFSTPDPLRALLLDRALEVNTDQMYDLLMPVHTQLGTRLPAFGGDMNLAGGRFANPFKRRAEPPLAWWSGIVDVPAEGLQVSVPVPDYYNGEVRIMAVGLTADTVGSAEARTQARAPLVLSPQVPLMAAPGDTFEAGLALRNTTDAPMTLTLGLTHDARLEIRTGLPERVELAPGAEKLFTLAVRATDQPGETTLRFTAADAATSRSWGRSVSLSVRPAVLPREMLRSGVASAKQFPALSTDRPLYPYMAMSSASVSATPLPPLRGLLRYLMSYPYTCTEQSLSRALPLILLERRPALAALLAPSHMVDPSGKPGKAFAEVRTALLEQAISALRTAFRPDRGLAAWPDYGDVDLLLTAYGGDLLLTLREAGLTVPGDLSTAYFRTLEQAVDTTPDTPDMARAQAYGLWVLTRSGVITTQRLNALFEQVSERWPDMWASDVITTLMAGSYATMNITDMVHTLFSRQQTADLFEPTPGPMNLLAARALHVTVLARHFPDRLQGQAAPLGERLLEGINKGYATFSAALAGRALLELAVRSDALIPADTRLECTAMQPGFTRNAVAPQAQTGTVPAPTDKGLPLLSLDAPGCTAFALRTPPPAQGSPDAQLYWEVATDGYDRTLPAAPTSSGLEITRTITRANATPLFAAPTKKAPGNPENGIVAQGAVLRVELTATLTGTASHSAVQAVVADLLPGGFELVLNHPGDSVSGASVPGPADDPDSDDADAQQPSATRVERREDRVLLHTTLRTTPVRVVYHLRAVNRGTFTLPAAYGEGLYDRTLHGNTAAGTITVR